MENTRVDQRRLLKGPLDSDFAWNAEESSYRSPSSSCCLPTAAAPAESKHKEYEKLK